MIHLLLVAQAGNPSKGKEYILLFVWNPGTDIVFHLIKAKEGILKKTKKRKEKLRSG